MEKGEKLVGKVALITGSDSGIGKASAIRFAYQGANVIITYHTDKKGAQETLEQVQKAGQKAIILQLDQSKEDEVEKVFDRAIKEFGKVDILMNNAGINFSGIKVVDMETEKWDKVIKTNLYGYFFCCRRFIKERLKNNRAGKIINVSSIHEETPLPGAAAYDCSKGAIKSLTRTLALELGEHKINVNNIAPGMILTPFNQGAIDDKELRNKQVQNIPLKRAGEPEEVANLALFLASGESDYVTGSTYYIDGGLMQNIG